MGILGNLFGKSLEKLAAGDDRDAFIQKLGRSEIRVIADMPSEGLDLSALSPEELRAELQTITDNLANREEFVAFVYERDGRRRLPFFTSEAAARTFVKSLMQGTGRMYPVQLLGVRGELLAQLIPTCDVFVMNDAGQDEVILSETDVAAMRRLWASGGPNA